MRIEVEPAPTGRALLVMVGMVGAGLLAGMSFLLGKRRGLDARADVHLLADAATHLHQSERDLLAAIR